MKVEKNLIEKVANNATNIKGKAVEIAKKIIDQKLASKFRSYAFFCYGNIDDIYDLQDCLLDFSWFGEEITVQDIPENIHPSKKWQIFGMRAEDSLKNLFYDMYKNIKLADILEGKEFRVRGIKGKFKVSYTLLHYCFAKGKITSHECLDMMRI